MYRIHLQNIEKETLAAYQKAVQVVKPITKIENILPYIFEEALIEFLAKCEKGDRDSVVLNYLNGRCLKNRTAAKK